MNLTEEDLRQIWRDLYTNVVMTSESHIPELVHQDARKTADAYVNALRAENKAAADVPRLAKGVDRDSLHDRASAHADRHLADQPRVRTAEEERRDVLAYIDSVDAGHLRDVVAHDKEGDRAAAMRSYELGKVAAGIRFDIEGGEHVGIADREAVKP